MTLLHSFERKRKMNKASKIGFIVTTAAIILSAASMVACQSNPTSAGAMPQEVSLSEAVNLRNAGAFILDVRQPEEWNGYHAPGSTLIPLAELESRAKELPRDQKIVVVCRSGNRSATGRDILQRAGFGLVTSLAGGLSQWKAAGYPTVTGP